MAATPPSNDEFYIGYQDQAPSSVRRRLRVFLILLSLFLLVSAWLIVTSQARFAGSSFELGQLTTVEGVLTYDPVPMLILDAGQDALGQPVLQRILLIGFGKHGAEQTLAAVESQRTESLENRRVTLEGTLIYYDGKTLLELTQNEASVRAVGEAVDLSPLISRQETVTLMGEIADPKCFFGVMKPGEGKVHRSCAARCIAGGIPPVLKAGSPDGGIDYYILKGADGQAINEQLLPVVGEPVQLSGRVIRYDDWQVLRLEDPTEILRLGDRRLLEEIPMCKPGPALSWRD